MPPRGPAYRPNSVPDNNRRTRQAPIDGQAAIERARTMREGRRQPTRVTLADKIRNGVASLREDIGQAGAWLGDQFASANANLAGAAGVPGGTPPGGGGQQPGGRGQVPPQYANGVNLFPGQPDQARATSAWNAGGWSPAGPPATRPVTQLPDTQSRGVLTYPGMPQYLVDMINTYNYNAMTGIIPQSNYAADRRNAALRANPGSGARYTFAPVLPPPPSGGGGGGTYDPYGGWGGGGGGGGGASDLNRWYESMVSWSIGQPKAA